MTMRHVQVKTRPRLRRIVAADPPTISRQLARIWFPESEEPDSEDSASLSKGAWLSGGGGAGSLTDRRRNEDRTMGCGIRGMC